MTTEKKTDPASLPVVLANGFGTPRIAARAYALVFRARGFQVFTVPQWALNYGDIRKGAKRLAKQVMKVRQQTGADKVHLVGMSLGGLTGLYYVKCAGGAAYVNRLISIGGPLNGSPLAYASAIPPLNLSRAFRQTRPDSELIREIRAAPIPSGVRLYTVGTQGDFITPRSCWQVAEMEPVETSHGVSPLGHWMLFVHPGNHQKVADLLLIP